MVSPIDQQDDPLQPPPLGQSLQAGRDAQSPAPGFQPGDLLSGWNKWVDKPNNRAALMQFGIAMLQPMGMGETGSSHFANAVGTAGEAHQNVTRQEQLARKEDTAATLRESTASAREQSANAAEMRALMSGQNTGLRLENTGLQNTIRQQQADTADRRAYEDYRSKTGQANMLAPKGQEEPILDFEGWRRSTGGGGRGSGLPASAAPTAGPAKWVDLQRDPRIQNQIASVRAHLSSGKPQDLANAKQWIQTVIAPQIDPAELNQVYATFGLTR